MSRSFSEQEKHLIRKAMIEQGRIAFSNYGFQKTSISEITKSVGIAQGTFYNFFKSKEELYFVILELEEERIMEQLLNSKAFKGSHPKQIIKEMLHQMIRIIETNPLIRELLIGTNLENMLRKIPPEILEDHLKNDSNRISILMKKWRSKGIIFKEKPEVIAGVLRSLFILTLHKREVGEAIYRDTVDVLINLIVEGLFEEE